jgi:hypothetical protein
VIVDFQLPIADFKNPALLSNRQSKIANSAMASLGLFVSRVFAATATEFTKLQPVRRGLLILGRNVVPALTFVTLKHNVVSRHNSNPGL